MIEAFTTKRCYGGIPGMKRLSTGISSIVFLMCLWAIPSFAIPVPAGHARFYLTGWDSITQQGGDAVGTPDIAGGTVKVVGSHLTGVKTHLKAKARLEPWHLLPPGQLFIDKEADGFWVTW
jgi:hypothetical protein